MNVALWKIRIGRTFSCWSSLIHYIPMYLRVTLSSSRIHPLHIPHPNQQFFPLCLGFFFLFPSLNIFYCCEVGGCIYLGEILLFFSSSLPFFQRQMFNSITKFCIFFIVDMKLPQGCRWSVVVLFLGDTECICISVYFDELNCKHCFVCGIRFLFYWCCKMYFIP